MGRDRPRPQKASLPVSSLLKVFGRLAGGGGGTLHGDALIWRGVPVPGGGGASVVTAQASYRAGVASLEMTQRRTVAYCELLLPMASA